MVSINYKDSIPMISVCVVTYQHGPYIRQALDGILMQKTDFPFEILIGEDESTDGTMEICKQYAEKYPNIIRLFLNSRKNVIYINGVPTGRWNFINLLKNARGKYIALCEGDDYWTDAHKLQKQVDFLESNPDYVSCYHDAMIVDENGSIVKQSKLPDNFKKDFSSEEISMGAWILTLTHCFRNLLRDFPAEFAYVLNGDTFFNSLLGNFGKGKYMADIAPSAYRIHPKSIWSSLDEINKYFQSGVTYAWLYRYYQRTGNIQLADHFRNSSIERFTKVSEKAASNHEGLCEDIIIQILTHYTDIIDDTCEQVLRGALKTGQSLIHVKSQKNISTEYLLNEIPGQNGTIYDVKEPANIEYMSCVYIENAIVFYYDNLLYTCCYPNHIKDEGILADLSDGNFNPQDIISKKREIILRRMKNELDGCTNCPKLINKKWRQNWDFSITRVNLNHLLSCNLKCRYCGYVNKRDKHTPTKSATIINAIQQLEESGLLIAGATFFIGNGEPSINKDMDELIHTLLNKNYKISVSSNGTVYKELYSSGINSNKMLLTLTPDAGNETSYKKIKGKDYFHTVWRNIKRYSESKKVDLQLSGEHTLQMHGTKNTNGIFSASAVRNHHKFYKDKLKLAIIDSSDTWYAQPKQIYDEFLKMGYECLWLARPNHEGARSTYVPQGYISICIANNLSPIDFTTRLPLTLDHPPLERAYKSKADFVFIGDKSTFLSYFSDRPNAFYMPYAVNTDTYKPINGTDELYDVGFVGNIKIEERKRKIELIKKHFHCFIGNKVFMDKANEFMNSCKIIFNTCDAKEINMRVFEALASGKLLVTDKVSYLDELFEDGVHLVTYSNETELIQKICYYLENEKDRKKIAQKGREIVSNYHTYKHRAEYIIDKIVESGLVSQRIGENQLSTNQKKHISQISKKSELLKDKKTEKFNILLATNHLFEYTGSEITLFTIAKKMREKGHTVFIYAKYINKNFIRIFHDIATVFNSIGNLSQHRFDVAYVQHNIIALEARYQFPKLPMVLASLGVLPFLEQPPLMDLNIHKYLAISEEVKENLIRKGMNESAITIFRNIVDSQKFKLNINLNHQPRSALIYSYKIDENKVSKVMKACSKLNIECRHIGENPGAIHQDELTDWLNKADIVFTLGRGAIETMMCGRIPIIFDHLGGDGMVTPENIDKLMRHNFSGRLYGIQYSVEDIINQIKLYNPENGPILLKKAIELFDADKGVDRLLFYLQDALVNPCRENSFNNHEELNFLIEMINTTKVYTTDTISLSLQKLKEIRTDNPDSPIRLHQKALDFFKQGRPHKAIKIMHQAISMDPGNAEYHNDLGVLYFHTGQNDKAAELFLRAIDLDHNQIDARKNLADLHAAAGRITEAEKLYKEILVKKPDDPETLVALQVSNKLSSFYQKVQDRFEEGEREEPFINMVNGFMNQRQIKNKNSSILRDPGTNYEIIPCPFCSSNKAEAVRFSADIVKCLSCHTVYLRTRMKREAMKKTYQTYADCPSHMALPKDSQAIKNSVLRRENFLKELLDFTKPEGTLLDVGCGWGAFLDSSRDHGFEVRGIEVTAKCVAFANETLKIPVTDEHFEDAAFKDESLSVITMLHVLEHLPEPRKAIENAFRILKPGGIFCGIVPNFKSLCSQELGEKWFWLDPQYHYVHYTPETLKKHLEGIGFSIEKIYTATGDYGRENVINVIRRKYALSDTDPIDSFFDRIESEGSGEEIRFFARKAAHPIENISYKESPETDRQIICSDAIFSKGNHRCVSIIIPVYNQVEYTSLCLDALYKNTPLERIREVIIVDNASSDGTREYLEKARDQYPKLKVITNKENLLFARACNQGGDIAEGDYLVFLNNDTEPLPEWVDRALERFEKDDSIGIVGIKLLYPDLTVQHCGIKFYRDVNPTYSIWPLHRYMNTSADDPRVNVPQDVHAVTGACLFIRRDFFRRIGGFEERYGMYFEDTDLCFKARRAGKRVFYEPGSVIIHHEGKSSPDQSVIDGLNAKSARLFFKLWKQDLYKYELETFIEKEEDKYVYLSDDFWPESTPEEIARIHNLLMSFPPCYVHFGGSGDALLLMSTFYDREPEQVIVSICNSTDMMRSFFDAFPKLKKVYFIPFPNNYVWHFIARRFFKSFDNCLGLGVTPTSKVDYGEWNVDLDIFESYGIQKRPSWAVNFDKNCLETQQVTIQPRGSLRGMTGSKRNAINHKNWSHLLSYMEKKGIKPIILGTPEEADEYPCLGNAIDKRSYSFTEQMKLIAGSDYFIGADSWGKTFSALAGIPTIVFHAMRGDDLKDWKDASDFVFLDPWEEITVVKDFKAFRKSFDAFWRERFPNDNEMKTKGKQKSHKKKGMSSTITPSKSNSRPRHFYLIRNEGMGDVLMALPATRALKQKYPGSKIIFVTDKRYKNIVRANPYIDDLMTAKGSTLPFRKDSKSRRGEEVWQLDPARFGIGEKHQIDAYLEEIGLQIPNEDKEIVLQIPESSVNRVNQLLDDIINSSPSAQTGKRPEIVLLHAAKNDPNRTWPEKHWDRLTQIILEEGYLVIATGNNSSDPKRGVSDISVPGIVNLVDQLSPLEFVALCRESNLLITTDSGVIQLAGASNIAIAGIYTVIPGRCRLPYRHGRLMWNSVSIEPKCKYAGCYLWMQNEKYFGPVNDRLKSGKISPHQLFAEWCLSEEKYVCLLNQITPEIVWKKSKDLLLYKPAIWYETEETKYFIEELLHRGEECFEHGDLERAVKVFERVLSLDQTNSQALNNLGVMQWQLGNVPSAINIFQKALNFNPNDRDALQNLIQAATETGRLDLINPTFLNTMKEKQQHAGFIGLADVQKNSVNAI